MKKEFLEFVRKAGQRKIVRFSNQFYIFLVCIVISVFLLALVKLSKSYFYTVDYRLIFTDIPENLVLESVSDSILTLQIRVQGFDIFTERYFYSGERTQEVNLRRIRVKNQDNHLRGFLLTAGIAKDISSKTMFPLEIYSTSPDTISFIFDKKNVRNR